MIRIIKSFLWIIGVFLLLLKIFPQNNIESSNIKKIKLLNYSDNQNIFLFSSDKITPTIEKKPQIILFHGSRNKKEIALTFDADMTPSMVNMLKNKKVASWFNEKIIDILNNTQTKATIFITGLWAETYPKETNLIAGNPLFEVGNHSYSHPSFNNNCYGLTPIPTNKKDEEIKKTQNILKTISGKDIKIFRFPGGCYTPEDLTRVGDLGLTVVQWDIVSVDGYNKNAESIINSVINNTQNGSIIVLHLHGGTFAPKTAEALPKIIYKLKEKGFVFVKISEFISQ